MNFDFKLDPFLHLDRFISEADKLGIKDPNAMTLSTVSPEGKPSSRIVLYKGLIRGGLSFFTNYMGKKSLDLSKNQHGSLCFYWREMQLQIRVDGVVAKLSRAESEKYFQSRPRISQIGAWASKQSELLSSVSELDAAFAEMEKKFANEQVIPCPPHWGGFHLIPTEFEFWFGQTGRLHHRYVYSRTSDASPWSYSMRYP